MLNHLHKHPTQPKRVVILGAKGFVGSTFVKKAQQEGLDCVALGREDLDLNHPDAGSQLARQLQAEDALVVISAKAPCKNHEMLLQNIEMMKSVCDALLNQPVRQVIYISSDAVYADANTPITESTLAAPTSLHGVMHLARELMLRSVVSEQALAILRPSLLYGVNDPHNGYGPNRFYRLAQANQVIELFGQGEEQRDHVYIDDVAELIYLCLMHQSYGILNIATGEVVSFYEITDHLSQVVKAVEVKCNPRQSPMPHNGYRAFDSRLAKEAFLGFQYTSFRVGLEKMHAAGDAHARD